MRLVIENSIQVCLRTLVFSIVLRHSNYNNRIISIKGTFLGTPCTVCPPKKYPYNNRIISIEGTFWGTHCIVQAALK
jgi:hypothetical protein